MLDPLLSLFLKVVLPAALGLVMPYTPELPADQKYHPSPKSVSSFVSSLYEAVPAPKVAAYTATDMQCTLELPSERSSWRPYEGVYVCKVDHGCGELAVVPVWFDRYGTLWFGPKNAGWLTAMHCPESITDPEQREKLGELIQRGG